MLYNPHMKDKYGDWTVLQHLQNKYVLCRCKCGTEKPVYKYNLLRGMTVSCGCSYRRPLTGKRFGKLVAIGEESPGRIICRCDCGTEKVIDRSALSAKHGTRSCGCSTKEFMREAKLTHGLSKSSEYSIWRAMLVRCYTKHHPTYKSHGARGIKVCKRWHKFEAFYADLGPRPNSHLCLERLDNNKNYTPTNCIWATYKQQENNRRDNINITYDGLTMTVSEWGDKLGIGSGIIYKRLNRGWNFKKALKTPSLRPQWKRKNT